MSESSKDTKEKAEFKKPQELGFNKRHLWWQALALIAISFFSVYASGAFDQEFAKFVPEKSVLVSTFNKRQSGISGLLEMLDKLGHKTKKWYYPYRQLDDFNGCLVITAPLFSLKDYEVKQILSWVKSGNDLVYFDNFNLSRSRLLPSQLEISVKTSVKKLERIEVPVNQKVPWLRKIDSVRVSTKSRLIGGKALVEDESGPIIVYVKHGKGRVILGCAPRMLSNDLIANSKNWNNFQFFENWLAYRAESVASGTDIYFDERSHGLTGGRNVFIYLSRGPFGLVSLQLILIILIALVSSAQRFGKALSVLDNRRISNMEFIDGLANAYKRAKANTSVLEILFHSFRVNVSKKMGVSSHEKDEVLVNAWNTAPITSDANLKDLIDEYNTVLSDRSISDSELLKMIATCDKITDTEIKGNR